MLNYKVKEIILHGLGTDFVEKREFLEKYFKVIA